MSTRHRAQVMEVSEDELRRRLEAGARDPRRSARVSADLELDVPLPSWDQARRVYTQNISHGGLMFRVPSPVRIPASARVILTLPDGSPIELDSEVRHAARLAGGDEVEVGVQFKAVPAEAEQALRAALAAVAG